MPEATAHSLTYRAKDGTPVIVVVPWSSGAGIVPPHTLTFQVEDEYVSYTFYETRGETQIAYPADSWPWEAP